MARIEYAIRQVSTGHVWELPKERNDDREFAQTWMKAQFGEDARGLEIAERQVTDWATSPESGTEAAAGVLSRRDARAMAIVLMNRYLPAAERDAAKELLEEFEVDQALQPGTRPDVLARFLRRNIQDKDGVQTVLTALGRYVALLRQPMARA